MLSSAGSGRAPAGNTATGWLKVLALVFDLVHVTPQEQETYFRHVQDLLAVTNAKEAQ